jgi:uncharacterized membrane protein YwaF
MIKKTWIFLFLLFSYHGTSFAAVAKPDFGALLGNNILGEVLTFAA